jgi:hypothetical protein
MEQSRPNSQEQEVDFLAGVCPLNPDNLEDCEACQ